MRPTEENMVLMYVCIIVHFDQCFKDLGICFSETDRQTDMYTHLNTAQIQHVVLPSADSLPGHQSLRSDVARRTLRPQRRT